MGGSLSEWFGSIKVNLVCGLRAAATARMPSVEVGTPFSEGSRQGCLRPSKMRFANRLTREERLVVALGLLILMTGILVQVIRG